MPNILVMEIGPTMGQVVPVRVVQQTHRTSKFGHGGSFLSVSGEISLHSSSVPEFPAYYAPGGETVVVYVRGGDHNGDDRVICVPVEIIASLKQAVLDYNKYFNPEEDIEGLIFLADKECKVTPAKEEAEAN